jgi:hypothetical protein
MKDSRYPPLAFLFGECLLLVAPDAPQRCLSAILTKPTNVGSPSVNP